MSVKLIAVKCPECGATLNIEEDRTQAFCTYCGTKVLVHNENEHIYRNIDEAGIARAKTERIVKEKQMEFAERRWIAQENRKKKRAKLALGLGIAGGILMVIGFMAGEATGNSDSSLYTIAMVGMFALEAAAFVTMSGKDEEDSDSIYYLTLNMINEFLKLNITTYQEAQSRTVNEDTGGVRIICQTVHKSKGLEYGTVVLPFTEEIISRPHYSTVGVDVVGEKIQYGKDVFRGIQ